MASPTHHIGGRVKDKLWVGIQSGSSLKWRKPHSIMQSVIIVAEIVIKVEESIQGRLGHKGDISLFVVLVLLILGNCTTLYQVQSSGQRSSDISNDNEENNDG